jgi:RHS repeat-associated protein
MRRYLLSLIAVGLWPTLTFAQTGTQVVEYYHTDALGSVRAVTKVVNGQTQVVSRHDYRPFGEEVAPQNPPVDNRLFTGKERDAETGQDYFGARYLRADLGRFTTVDPLQAFDENMVDPQRWNRYVYVRNSPLTHVDPDGRSPVLWARLLQAAQRIGASPIVQRASTWSENVGWDIYFAAARFFNSAAGQEAVQAIGELATGAQAPPRLLPALSATTKAAFIEGAVAESRGGVSAAGRALASHATRAASWLAGLAEAGNGAANTAAARKALGPILESGQVTTMVHKVWGPVVTVRLPDGRGAVWTAKGEFVTFLDGYTPKK